MFLRPLSLCLCTGSSSLIPPKEAAGVAGGLLLGAALHNLTCSSRLHWSSDEGPICFRAGCFKPDRLQPHHQHPIDPTSPATATACNNLCRCLLGAGEAAVIIQMIDAMGRGWCFTFIALVIYMTMPILWVIMRYGPAWREERAQKIDAEKMVNAAEEERR